MKFIHEISTDKEYLRMARADEMKKIVSIAEVNLVFHLGQMINEMS